VRHKLRLREHGDMGDAFGQVCVKITANKGGGGSAIWKVEMNMKNKKS
jgi:hypothetical protein